MTASCAPSPTPFTSPTTTSYLEEDLVRLFADCGLRVTAQKPVFLSKLVVCEKV